MNMGSSLLLLSLLAMVGRTLADGGLCDLLHLLEGHESLGNQTQPIKDNSSCNDVGEPLILTRYIYSGNIGKAKKKARLHPNELTQIGRGFAAYITVKPEYESNLFFWYSLTKDRKKTSTAPLVIWLNGGPGASSLFGLFNENGPYVIDKKDGVYSVHAREFSWAKEYNMLYIDQPAGTGYSFFKDQKAYATDGEMIANDMYEFIKQFFLLFPHRMQNKFYITGQSYAGKYIPVITDKIMKMNDGKLEKDKIPLTGVAISNGLTDPIRQFFFSDVMFQVGLVGKKNKDIIANGGESIRKLIEGGKLTDAALTLGKVLLFVKGKTGVDLKNYLFEENKYIKPSTLYYVGYITSSRIRPFIHVGNKPFASSTPNVCNFLLDDFASSVADQVGKLLDSGRKVLISSGHLDAYINYRGTERYIRALTWKGADEYKKATRKIWMVDGVVAGYAREVLTLRQVMVRNAGHAVLIDQPKWSFDMIKRFINGDPFGNPPGRNSSG